MTQTTGCQISYRTPESQRDGNQRQWQRQWQGWCSCRSWQTDLSFCWWGESPCTVDSPSVCINISCQCIVSISFQWWFLHEITYRHLLVFAFEDILFSTLRRNDMTWYRYVYDRIFDMFMIGYIYIYIYSSIVDACLVYVFSLPLSIVMPCDVNVNVYLVMRCDAFQWRKQWFDYQNTHVRHTLLLDSIRGRRIAVYSTSTSTVLYCTEWL